MGKKEKEKEKRDSHNKIEVKILPSYSTERFYLLSELEELCGPPAAIHDKTPATAQAEKYWRELELNSNERVLVYILWNEETGITGLITAMEMALGGQEWNAKNSLPIYQQRIVGVEILLSEKGKWTQESQIFFTETLKQVAKKYPAFGFLFGVADDFATPALEGLLQVAISFKDQKCRIIAAVSEDYLGHNKNVEPDAVSGVFQALLTLQLENTGLCDPEKITPDQLEKASSKFDLIRSQGIMFLLVACLSWFLYVYFNENHS